jgi:hypothetical protein
MTVFLRSWLLLLPAQFAGIGLHPTIERLGVDNFGREPNRPAERDSAVGTTRLWNPLVGMY